MRRLNGERMGSRPYEEKDDGQANIDKGGVMQAATREYERTPLQTAAMAVGGVFLVVGVLGFIPGITTDYDTMTFASDDSDAELLGIFEVNALHNIVHLLFGVVGLAAARAFDTSRLFLIGGGVIYAVLWIYGVIIDFDSGANFVSLNTADNWLHFVLAVGMIGLGVLLGRGAGVERGTRRTDRDRLAT
jgi:Domain of unknown function (DUF4383)